MKTIIVTGGAGFDPPILISDPSRARETLGWNPRFRDVDEQIATAWRWFREQWPCRVEYS